MADKVFVEFPEFDRNAEVVFEELPEFFTFPPCDVELLVEFPLFVSEAFPTLLKFELPEFFNTEDPPVADPPVALDVPPVADDFDPDFELDAAVPDAVACEEVDWLWFCVWF